MKCTQCGRCCKAEVCNIGKELFDDIPPCKGLIFKNGKYYCGAIVFAANSDIPMAEEILKMSLGIGAGCDSIFAEEHVYKV